MSNEELKNAIEKFNKRELELIFAPKLTENGDLSFNTTGNRLIDLLFMSEYYTNHTSDAVIGNSDIEKIFSMFIRDPRFGLGRRDFGRHLMQMSGCTPEMITLAGRFDDLYLTPRLDDKNIGYLFDQCFKGNQLAKKWMPRYSSKHLLIARKFAKMLGMNKQQYGKFIKAETVENTMSRQDFENIVFEHVPSLASIKYAKAFARQQPERYAQYLEDVRSGKKKLNVSTTNVYDIYRNRESIDADLFYSKLEKISINCVPVIDVSGSMFDNNDSIGKALSIGKYLSDCSSYMKGYFVTFSGNPQLVEQTGATYIDNIENIERADWGYNTDFAKVIRLFSELKEDFPEYIVVLSDMEFDRGSCFEKEKLMNDWKRLGINTKIIWWNFNSRSKTCPEMDDWGNIFMSGYSPVLLKFLCEGFDAKQFLAKLLEEYAKSLLNSLE